MNKDYGIKIAKEGSSINSQDTRDILFSSSYSMLKYYKDTTGSVTLVPGDTEKTADIQHNLGYVPAFIAYAKDLDGKMHYISAPPYPAGYDFYMYAYADTVKIRVGFAYASTAYNKITPGASDYWSTHYGNNGATEVGNEGGGTDGAFRFTGITIDQGTTISSAILNFYVGVKGAGAGNLKAKYYGIDEDNTAAFGDPMGRTRTTAFTTEDSSLPSQGEYSNHDVTAQVQEIINRAGWSNGNALGILIFDNGSASDVWIYDSPSGTNTTLTITYGSNTTLTFRTIIFKNKIA